MVVVALQLRYSIYGSDVANHSSQGAFLDGEELLRVRSDITDRSIATRCSVPSSLRSEVMTLTSPIEAGPRRLGRAHSRIKRRYGIAPGRSGESHGCCEEPSNRHRRNQPEGKPLSARRTVGFDQSMFRPLGTGPVGSSVSPVSERKRPGAISVKVSRPAVICSLVSRYGP